MAAGLADVRDDVEAQIGQPVTAFLAGLSGPGVAKQGSAKGVLHDWGVSGRGHDLTGGATSSRHVGLLVVTSDGVLHLYRTTISKGRYQIEAEVASWADHQARVRMDLTASTIVIGVFEETGRVLAFELYSDPTVYEVLVQPFAAAVGVDLD